MTAAVKNWITVASADHVAIGRAGGFIQSGHGKRAPLLRVQPGDRIVCYSPAQQFGSPLALQAYTEIGVLPRANQGAKFRDPATPGLGG